MIFQKMAVFFVRKFVEKGIVQSDEKEIYEYGFEVLGINILHYINILILSVMFCKNINIGIIYLLCFISTRTYCGGYHADTYIKCFISMGITFYVFNCLRKLLLECNIYFVLGIYVFSLIPILIFSPVVSKEKDYISNIEGNIGKGIYIIWSVMGFFLFYHKKNIGIIILCTLNIVSGTIWYEILRRKEGQRMKKVS